MQVFVLKIENFIFVFLEKKQNGKWLNDISRISSKIVIEMIFMLNEILAKLYQITNF